MMRSRLVLIGLLASHALLAVTSLRRNSVTVDEVAHLPAGVTYWQQGTFALYHHNPPLVKLLAALPVLTSHPKVDYSGSWASAFEAGYPPSQAAFGAEFMRANADRYFELFFRARYVIVALSVLGGCFVFLWARSLWGWQGGLISTALWSFSPNVIAHAGLVTTDLAATVAGLAATYVFWRWLHGREERGTGTFPGEPSTDANDRRRGCLSPFLPLAGWLGAVGVGALLGVAQLVKFTSLMWYSIWPALAAGWWLLRRRKRGGQAPSVPSSRRLHGHTQTVPVPLSFATGSDVGLMGIAGRALVILLISLLVINAGYGLEGTGRRLGSYTFVSPDLTVPRTPGSPVPMHPDLMMQEVYRTRQNRFTGTWLGRLPVPLPEHYVLGFDEQRFESDPGLPTGGYPVYLRGQVRRTGWWYYYLYALLVKVPLGTWLLVMGALVAAATLRRCRAGAADEFVLLVPPLVVLFTMSFLTDINIGLRYVLPVFPFVFVSLGRLGGALQPAGGTKGDRHPRQHAFASVDSSPSKVPVPLASAAGAAGLSFRALAGLGLGWNLAAAIVIWPHYLAYFNEPAGGPSQGHRHLIDSNLDWGQDLLELKRWIGEHPESQPIWLAYFGTVDPNVGGMDYRLPPRDPCVVPPAARLPAEGEGLRPGWYAISVNYVQGLPFRSYSGQGRSIVPIPQDAYAYFQDLEPAARAGYSIWIYHVDADAAARIENQWRKGRS